jgi:hypothetical protein
VLLSESDLPLYDPLTFYQQLVSEAKSRINACAPPWQEAYVKSSVWRWTPPMQVTHHLSTAYLCRQICAVSRQAAAFKNASCVSVGCVQQHAGSTPTGLGIWLGGATCHRQVASVLFYCAGPALSATW